MKKSKSKLFLTVYKDKGGHAFQRLALAETLAEAKREKAVTEPKQPQNKDNGKVACTRFG